MELFPKEQIVGVFRGFREGGLEFHADLVLPYRNDFQRIPMHGQFVLVQLETPEEAVLGRIASLSAEGKLSHGSGEEFNIRAVQEDRTIPEDLREQYLKYRINIRVLGVLRNGHANTLTFVPSHRRLPHVGSSVAFPSGEVLQEICGHNLSGAEIGHFALGEYIFAGQHSGTWIKPWMRIESPSVLVRFPMESLVARRSFVFARAGFGKSNLNKLLFSKLYETTPTVEKRGGRQVPVGTIIFDPDGEYFWPDDKNRPGLCDVPHLQDKLIVFTPRSAPSPFYRSFVAGGIRLDIRQLPPSDVISIALPRERQDQQNVSKLRALPPAKWIQLVDLIDRDRGGADLDEIGTIMNMDNRQDAERIAVRSNMTNVVGMLHDKSSQFMGLLLKGLEAGKICVVDVSQMRGAQAFVLAGLILRRIFDRNQEEFINARPKTIPTIAVIEEAQTVLNERANSAEPYIAWVKEGRKYDLGALLITQQPGAIPNEILSQGDNWFIFHLLSSADLGNAKRANAHFSDDLLSSLLNEPIEGQGIFWSSVGGKSYPVSIRALSFEDIYRPADPEYSRSSVPTFADDLRRFSADVAEQARSASVDVVRRRQTGSETLPDPLPSDLRAVDDEEDGASVDIEVLCRELAANALRDNQDVSNRLAGDGAAWGHLVNVIEESLPSTLDNANKKAFQLVPPTLDELFGRQDSGWHSFKHPKTRKTYVRKGPKPD